MNNPFVKWHVHQPRNKGAWGLAVLSVLRLPERTVYEAFPSFPFYYAYTFWWIMYVSIPFLHNNLIAGAASESTKQDNDTCFSTAASPARSWLWKNSLNRVRKRSSYCHPSVKLSICSSLRQNHFYLGCKATRLSWNVPTFSKLLLPCSAATYWNTALNYFSLILHSLFLS